MASENILIPLKQKNIYQMDGNLVLESNISLYKIIIEQLDAPRYDPVRKALAS